MLARARARARRAAARIERLETAIARDRELHPGGRRRSSPRSPARARRSPSGWRSFDAALVADREAGEHVAGELRACAQQEAALHSKLQAENEALTDAEVRLERARDRAADVRVRARQLAARLELDAEPATRGARRRGAREPARPARAAGAAARAARSRQPARPAGVRRGARARRGARDPARRPRDRAARAREADRRHRPPDPDDVRADVRGRRARLRGARRAAVPGRHRRAAAGQRARRDRRGCSAARRARTSDDAEDAAADDVGADGGDEDLLGVEIEITPAGKECRRLSLLSGGEKSMTALAFLFAVFLARPCPFYILDEVEAALDDLNIDRFLDAAAPVLVAGPVHRRHPPEADDGGRRLAVRGFDGRRRDLEGRLAPAADAEAA